MIRTTVRVSGMACGMCEAHVNDAVRSAFPVKKVRSSKVRGKTVIESETPLDHEKLRQVINNTGYLMLSASEEEMTKRICPLLISGNFSLTEVPPFRYNIFVSFTFLFCCPAKPNNTDRPGRSFCSPHQQRQTIASALPGGLGNCTARRKYHEGMDSGRTLPGTAVSG